MARVPPLLWAVPTTLAVLVLAKSAIQPRTAPSTSPHANPSLVEHLDPPGRLHVSANAQPVTTKSRQRAVQSPTSAPSAGKKNVATKPASPLSPLPAERAPREVEAGTSRPGDQPQLAIVYPITDASDLPLLPEAWPGSTGQVQRLPLNTKVAPSPSAAGRTTNIQPLKVHDQALDAVRQRAQAMNQRAVKLAQRGALYSARAELLDALRLFAQAQDAQNQTGQRVAALAAALAAMDEADDFSPPPSAARRTSEPLADIIRPHQTPVLKRIDTTRLSSLAASQHYLAYAQQQLALAAGADPVAAQSLYLLGKVHSNLAAESSRRNPPHTARAIVFHQAALSLNPRHYQAANELGVLLARCGELAAARQVLLTSVTSHPTPTAWQNLAAVHERLGEGDLAKRARYEVQLLADTPQQPAGRPPVQWLDAATFAAQSPPTGGDPPSGKTIQAAAVSASKKTTAVRR